MRFILFFILLLASIYTLEAQKMRREMTNYSVRDGLPSSEVYDVLQDDQGYMWFATDRGVSRFDGYDFKNFTNHDGLTDNVVFKFFVDEQKRIWCNGWVSKLCYFENGRLKQYRYNQVLSDSLGSLVKELRIHYDHANTLHVFSAHGYCIINSKGEFEWVCKNFPSLETSTLVTRIIEGKAYSYLEQTDSIQIKTYLGDSLIYSIQSKHVFAQPKYSMIKDNKLYILDEHYLQIIDSGKRFAVNLEKRIISLNAKEEDVHLGLYQGGEKWLSNKPSHIEFNNLSISSICETKDGGRWYATLEKGVYYMPSQAIKNDPSYSNCVSVYKNNDEKYIAYSDGSIKSIVGDRLVPAGNLKEKLDFVQINKVQMVRGEMYFLLTGKRGHKSYQVDSITDHIVFNRSIVKLNDSTLYSLGYGRITKYVNDQLIVRNQTKLNIRSAFLHDSTIFLGTTSGLYRLEGEIPVKVLDDNEPFSSRIEVINEIDSCLLLGTIGNGLIIYSEDTTYSFTTENGLSSNVISCVFVDENDIWIGTNKGVNHLRYFRKSLTLLKKYSSPQLSEINDLYVSGDEVFVASKEGLKIVPRSLNTTAPSPIYITGIKLNGVAESVLQSRYSLTHDQNKISIQYTALNYVLRDRLRYRYKLTGLDTSWSYSNTREITFSALSPGDYNFKVAVQDENGAWSKNEAQVDFVIYNPFWKRGWFIIIVFISLALMLFGLFYGINNKRKKENQIAELKAKALMLQINPHFIFNALNSIRMLVIKNADEADNYIVRFSKLMRSVLSNSTINYTSIENEISLLENYIQLEQMRSNHVFTYSIHLDEEVETSAKIPTMILQPFVENAILHGLLPQNSGYLSINFSTNNTSIKCKIRDNGVGLKSKSMVSKGMDITYERLKYIAPKSKIEVVNITKENQTGVLVEIDFKMES